MKIKDIDTEKLEGRLLVEAVIKLQESTYLTDEEILENLTARAGVKSYRFETFEGKNGDHYFRFTAPNNEIMLQSEGYKSKSVMMKSIRRLQEKVIDAPILAK